MDIQNTQMMSSMDKNQSSWKVRYWSPMTEEMMEDDVDMYEVERLTEMYKKERQQQAKQALSAEPPQLPQK